MNKKLKYGFQISENYRALCVGEEFDYKGKRDGAEDQSKDVGVCLTCVIGLEWSKSQGVWVEIDGQKIGIGEGDVLIMKSRIAGEYSVMMDKGKSFALLFWVHGPFDKRDRLF